MGYADKTVALNALAASHKRSLFRKPARYGPARSVTGPYKLVRVITRLNVGGPAIHTVLLTRELRTFGYCTTLVTGACEAADGDMSYLIDHTKDPVCWIPEMSRSVSPWRNLRAFVRLLRIIRRERPDIVHTHTAMAGCLGRLAAMLAGVPVVVHTFHGNSLQGYFRPWTERIFINIERLLARFTDAICVVCEQQLTEISDRFRIAPRSLCHVVQLGLDLSPFEALPPPVLDAAGPLRVGWFGRLVSVKNIPLFIQIIQATLKRSRAVEFHVVGDGSERDSILSAVERYGPRLIWHGWQKDITPIVEKCHVLLQTSHNEGTPAALIQGMAAARPFLSTAVGGLVDLVAGPILRRSEGCSWYSNGILADSQPEAFASALVELLDNPETIAAMGGKARLSASAKYRKETLLSNLDSLYRELLRKKSFRTAPYDKHPALFGEEGTN